MISTKKISYVFLFKFQFIGDEDGIESASENISLSQLKKKNRRIKSLDHPSDPDPDSSPAAAVGQRRRHTSSGQSQVNKAAFPFPV